MCNRLRGGIRLAQTHRFLAATDKTSLTPRCFKQAYRNVLRNLEERKDAEKDLALPQLVRAERDLALAEKGSAAAALNLQTTYNVPGELEDFFRPYTWALAHLT
jgi:hypothetical protein